MRQCLILDFFGTMLVASRAEAWNYPTIHLLAGDGHRIECALGIFQRLSQHSIAHCSTEPWNYRKAAIQASFRNAQECEAFCAGEADGIITQFRIWPVVADLITGVSVQQHKSQIKCVFPLLHDMNRNQSPESEIPVARASRSGLEKVSLRSVSPDCVTTST